ncbi:MAG TPA: hypothetical protein VLL76_09845 [Candidatus Omnitrophota bacterium]|nr:hypothetical protein [Candidatus Omnitrophota bacterium]
MDEAEFELEMARLGFTEQLDASTCLVAWYNPRLKIQKILSRPRNMSDASRARFIEQLRKDLNLA